MFRWTCYSLTTLQGTCLLRVSRRVHLKILEEGGGWGSVSYRSSIMIVKFKMKCKKSPTHDSSQRLSNIYIVNVEQKSAPISIYK